MSVVISNRDALNVIDRVFVDRISEEQKVGRVDHLGRCHNNTNDVVNIRVLFAGSVEKILPESGECKLRTIEIEYACRRTLALNDLGCHKTDNLVAAVDVSVYSGAGADDVFGGDTARKRNEGDADRCKLQKPAGAVDPEHISPKKARLLQEPRKLSRGYSIVSIVPAAASSSVVALRDHPVYSVT